MHTEARAVNHSLVLYLKFPSKYDFIFFCLGEIMNTRACIKHSICDITILSTNLMDIYLCMLTLKGRGGVGNVTCNYIFSFEWKNHKAYFIF